MTPITLSGTHVLLEPLTPSHAGALVKAANEDRTTYRLAFVPGSLDEMHRYIDEARAAGRSGEALPFALVERRSGRAVGSTRFANLERWTWPPDLVFQGGGTRRTRADGSPDAVEIGWTWLAASAQRTAINTEAKLLLLRHAFESWGVYRVNLKTDARNRRSRAAIERLGASLDGVLRAHMPAAGPEGGGGIRDTALYTILDREWADVRSRLEAFLSGGGKASDGR